VDRADPDRAATIHDACASTSAADDLRRVRIDLGDDDPRRVRIDLGRRWGPRIDLRPSRAR
jgi:hypothetical protein